MPLFESFGSPVTYYATLAHELTHRTKHDKRLALGFGRNRWGDDPSTCEAVVNIYDLRALGVI